MREFSALTAEDGTRVLVQFTDEPEPDIPAGQLEAADAVVLIGDEGRQATIIRARDRHAHDVAADMLRRVAALAARRQAARG